MHAHGKPAKERILDCTKQTIECFGVSKMSVPGVARLLGLRHTNVYHHFPSKKALIEAVVLRWLETIHAPLWPIAEASDPAGDRLSEWFRELIKIAQQAEREEQHLFHAYRLISAESAGRSTSPIEQHWQALEMSLTQILFQGCAEGVLDCHGAPEVKARALLDAMALFYRPEMMVLRRSAEPRFSELEGLLLATLMPVERVAQ